MDGQRILMDVNSWLVKLSRGEVSLTPAMVDTMNADIKTSLLQEHTDEFRLRMSNLGRSTCQLQQEKMGSKRVPKREQQQSSIFAFGHMAEAWLVMVMRAAGVPITSEQETVELKVGGSLIKGTMDLTIKYNEDVVWDIKSASDYAFKKFKSGFDAVHDSDPFGYIDQGFGYGKAAKKRFGGWIVINKNTSEICVCETPMVTDQLEKESMERIKTTIKTIESDAPFKRGYDDEPETFRKKVTGNRKLAFACEWCDFRESCWEGVTHRPSVMSTAMEPPWYYYTELNNLNEEEEAV